MEASPAAKSTVSGASGSEIGREIEAALSRDPPTHAEKHRERDALGLVIDRIHDQTETISRRVAGSGGDVDRQIEEQREQIGDLFTLCGGELRG